MGKRRSRKNANGQGSIWLRADGRYGSALTYEYYDPSSGTTRKKRLDTTKRTSEEAHKWLVGKQADLLGSVAVSPQNPTVGEFLDDWLRDTVKPHKAPKTYQKREYFVRIHIRPNLGSKKIKSLKSREIQALHALKARGDLAPSTRREIHVTLKTALKQAVRWGLIPANPADHVDAPSLVENRDEEDEIRAFSNAQALRLFAATAGTRFEHYFVIAVRTGLRPGELLGLKWEDLDLDAYPATLRVRRTLHSKVGGGTYFSTPKSKAGRRKLALHWEAADALRNQKIKQQEVAGETWSDGGLVFTSTTGTPVDRRNFATRILKPALRVAGLPHLTLHGLRHTFASIMLFEWRVDPKTVQEMLGHASIRMTMDVYGHLFPNSQEDAIRRLHELYGAPPESTVTVTSRSKEQQKPRKQAV